MQHTSVCLSVCLSVVCVGSPEHPPGRAGRSALALLQDPITLGVSSAAYARVLCALLAGLRPLPAWLQQQLWSALAALEDQALGWLVRTHARAHTRGTLTRPPPPYPIPAPCTRNLPIHHRFLCGTTHIFGHHIILICRLASWC
jgi:hypothetical protein